MRPVKKLFLFLTALIGTSGSAQEPKINAEKIAIDAYIYGYPLVTMDQTRLISTNVAKPEGTRAPMGQFANLREYPGPDFKDITTPNADTLYSAAWLDLSKEPYILHVPNEQGRYYLMPILSAWTDVIASPGTRTTGTQEGDFVLTGPSWNGSLPPQVKEIKSPTNLVWILGRTYATGTKEDYEAVHKLQDQYTLTPLSAYGKRYVAPNGTVNPNLDMKTAVRDQVNRMSGVEFFSRLAELMQANPPSKADAPLIAEMAKIGIIPGQPFDHRNLSPEVLNAIEKAPKVALGKIVGQETIGSRKVNGWLVTTQTGTYGTDYIQRAFVALFGLGANIPQDAIYPMANEDSEGQPLTGEHQYVIHFAQLPPVNAFWSLTMYNDQNFFVKNPLNRYTLSSRNNLKKNPDGSFDLYIQHESPGKDKESNWLPAPNGRFNIFLRLYWPKDSVLDGDWEPPAVKRVK